MSNYSVSNLEQLSGAFKALSNPNRLQIFQRLLSCCEPGTICSANTVERFYVSELGEDISVAPSTLSHHIKELQRSGLIKTQRKGKNVECYVDPNIVKVLGEFFAISVDNTRI